MTQTLIKDERMRQRLSIPGPGSTVSLATEERASFVRQAVAVVEAALKDHGRVQEAWESLLGGRSPNGTLANGTPAWSLAAWGLVAIRLVGRLQGSLERSATLRDAEKWFVGETEGVVSVADLIGEVADRKATKWLERIAHDDDLHDLLPYVLDAHGPGSRASVLKDPGTRRARDAKRAGGVFYTPADVAEYIAATAIQNHGGHAESLRYLDPACGTGVFLKAVLHCVGAGRDAPLDRLAFAEQCLFGFDVDPLAVQSACFVMLGEILSANGTPASAWGSWHSLRLNIVVADALTIECQPSGAAQDQARAGLRERLRSEYVPPCRDARKSGAAHGLFGRAHFVADVLPEIADGADVVLGNPPYAAIGARDDASSLETRFASFSGHGKGDLFPLFVEMMWRLARPGRSAAGMVVPLSLAFHGGSQMRACRRAIGQSGGCWRFAFFDREPHALFGEDVKTRNTIILRAERSDYPERGRPAVIETGPLRKWTSRTRGSLFGSIDFTRLEDGSIGEGIPKLCGQDAAHAFATLERSPHRLRSIWVSASACFPADACIGEGAPRVFVAGTAYNFLNVFRPHESLPAPKAPWSESRLHCFEFADEATASMAMAILASRATFWLWHVLGDGFHVSRSFLEELPFSLATFSAAERDSLGTLGSEFWRAVQRCQIVSVNGGRQTVAYRPHGCERIRDRIDGILLSAAGIESGFADRLREFVRQVVTVDTADERRQRFTAQFNEWEAPS
ncbi:MAG: hypothetical protein HRU75_04930 [Planctomycetia bacterium]|nr:MAG: hypothetical protein HRU75_04930 [Planctomycetia bacterium]